MPGGRVDAGENVEQALKRELEEETGLHVKIVRKIGEYHESGVQDGIEYDYYPACFLVRPIGGKMKKQEGEIEEISVVDLQEIPEKLAFKHAKMLQDYMRTREE